MLLTALRVGLLVLACYMLYGWMIRPYRTDLADVVVVIDDFIAKDAAETTAETQSDEVASGTEA